jgi:translocation and assembly module TamB
MRKFLKITSIVVAILILLVVGTAIYLNTESGQNFVRGRVEAYLHNKLKTEVHIGHLGYSLPKYIVFNNTIFFDQAHDTLFAVGKLKVDLDMMKLLHKKVDVQQILVDNLHTHIYRKAPDTAYNFTYIVNAFGGHSSTTANSSSSFSFHLDRVKLDTANVRFDDETAGTKLATHLGHLDLRVTTMDIDSMLFHIRDLNVSGARVSYVQDTSYLPPTSRHRARLKLIADNVDLKSIAVHYDDNMNKFLYDMDLGSLQVQLREYNRTNNSVNINKLALNNTSAVLKIGKSSRPPSPVDTIVKIDTTEGWLVNAKQVQIGGVNFKMDNENEPRLKYGMDYNHLDVKGLAVDLHDLSYNSDTVLGDLRHFAVAEQSGLKVNELRTVFNYSSNGVILRNLYLHTPSTTLQNYVAVRYPSLEDVRKRIGSMQVNVNLQNSYVGIRDLSLFVPSLQQQAAFRRFSGQRVKLEAKMTGSLDNLNIAKFQASGLSNTELAVSGVVRGLPSVKNLSYNLHISSARSSRQDVSLFVPPSKLSAVRLPDRFGVVGQLAGTAYDYKGALILASTDGYASVRGQLSLPPHGTARYTVVGETRQFNFGRVLKMDSIRGPITASFDVRGQGLDVKTMSATVKADIASAYIRRYRYHDITLSAKAENQHIDGTITSTDVNAHLQASGFVDFKNKYPAILLDTHIDSLDLQALHIVNNELRLRGDLHADFPVLNPDYPDGRLAWYQPVITASGTRYFADSIFVVSHPTADSGQNIYANLDVLQAHITGHMPLTKIGPVIADHIDRHYAALPVKDTTLTYADGHRNPGYLIAIRPRRDETFKTNTAAVPSEYDLQFNVVAYDKPILHSLLPGLTSFDSLHADGTLTPHKLTFDANVPELVYNDVTVRNAAAQLRGNDSNLTYQATADQISNFKVGVWYAKVNGSVDHNLITANVSLSDSLKKEQFAAKADMRVVGPEQVIHLDTGLKLNYVVWQVAQPNAIVLTSKGLYVQNFEISNAGQTIKAASAQLQANSPLRIDINNFQLANLSSIISRTDTLPVSGALGGIINITRMSPSLQMNGDLNVQAFSLYGDTLGDMHAVVSNKDEAALNANVTLTGHGNNISLVGVYYLRPVNGNNLDLTLSLDPLAVHSIEGIVSHQISNTSGYLRGNLKVQGTLTDPHLEGRLVTDNLRTTVPYLGTEYRMPHETIEFYQYQMVFNNFHLVDSAGNQATINGSIATVEWSDLDFDLTLKANNWRAVHSTASTAKDNELFYGDLYVTSDIKIKGTSTNPSIDGSIQVLKNTKFTIINPAQNSEAQSSKGVVVFADIRDTTHLLASQKKDTVAKRKIAAGSGLNVGITVDKSAEFSLIVDEASGDFVSIHGDANLIVAIRPGGAMDVTGVFTATSGYYQFNYNFIKRKFTIQPGSTVTFAGDPYTATSLNVTAIYEARVAPYDLVSRQVPDPTELTYYRQGLPFQVSAHMVGNLETPTFTFDVTLPENKIYPLSADKIELVQAKLSQMRSDTSELNKQVFAILILNRFVSDDPFSSGATGQLTNTAVQSISTFIGEQLNQMAGRLIQGIDLSVDVASTDDYTTGDLRRRTDLNVAASKRILNDRLKLTVGNDFELEGPQTAVNNQSSIMPSNLAADYMLSPDGRYTLRAYRRNYDAGVLEGFISETGLNFIVTADYNRFKQVFTKRKPRGSAAPPQPRSDSSVNNAVLK